MYFMIGQVKKLIHQVYSRHIAEAAHDEAYEYYETLKAKIAILLTNIDINA